MKQLTTVLLLLGVIGCGTSLSGKDDGFTAWTTEQGDISLHNPGTEPADYDFILDRDLGLLPGSGPFQVRLPLADGLMD